MVSTRSKTAQTQLEDFTPKDSSPKHKHQPTPPKKTAPKANTSRKRKSTSTTTKNAQPSSKRTKTSPPKQTAKSPDVQSEDAVFINRAPVLHLWAASVARLIYPDLPWEMCLSAGSAISTICAVAKGRSIGKIAEKDPEAKGAKENNKADEDLEVMHFDLKLRNGLVLVGGDDKGNPGDEDALRRKFGEGAYERVRDVFEEALKGWEGEVGELNKKAFKMYEEFRPDVRKGQKGWGRKGELRFEKVRSVVGNESF